MEAESLALDRGVHTVDDKPCRIPEVHLPEHFALQLMHVRTAGVRARVNALIW